MDMQLEYYRSVQNSFDVAKLLFLLSLSCFRGPAMPGAWVRLSCVFAKRFLRSVGTIVIFLRFCESVYLGGEVLICSVYPKDTILHSFRRVAAVHPFRSRPGANYDSTNMWREKIG